MAKESQQTLFREGPETFMDHQKSPESLLLSANPYHKAFYHLQMEWVKQQLSGDMLADIGTRFLGYINQSLHFRNLKSCTFSYSSAPDYHVVSLRKWIRHSMVHSATRAFFGEEMFIADPNFLSYYFGFEEAAWKMLFQYPRILAEDLYGSAEKTLRTMTRYYDTPQDERQGLVWMFKTIEAEMRQLGLPSHDIAVMTFMLFWG